MNAPDSKNTQNRTSFSCGVHHVRAFTRWPFWLMLNNAGSSFENLTWSSELVCFFTAVALLIVYSISLGLTAWTAEILIWEQLRFNLIL